MIEAVQTLSGNVRETGIQGLSAYEVYKKNGGTLSEEEWLLSLKGEKGDKGDTGEQGIQGIQGEQGIRGEQGENGITPTIGDNGNWFIGDTDTGLPSRGEQGESGEGGVSLEEVNSLLNNYATTEYVDDLVGDISTVLATLTEVSE